MMMPHAQQLAEILGIESIANLDGATIDGERVKDLIRTLAKSVGFDENFYLTTYKDIKNAVKDGQITSAHEHYYNLGVFEGRLPCIEFFDSSSYLAANEDLTLSLGATPNKKTILEHYILYGFPEGRKLNLLEG